MTQRTTAAAVAASLVLVTTLTACDVGRTTTKTVTIAPRILDTEKVERAIEDSIYQQRKLKATVSCPSGTLQRKDLPFSCVATTADGIKTTFDVDQKDDAGNVHYAAR